MIDCERGKVLYSGFCHKRLRYGWLGLKHFGAKGREVELNSRRKVG